jgi:hypothetical protein
MGGRGGNGRIGARHGLETYDIMSATTAALCFMLHFTVYSRCTTTLPLFFRREESSDDTPGHVRPGYFLSFGTFGLLAPVGLKLYHVYYCTDDTCLFLPLSALIWPSIWVAWRSTVHDLGMGGSGWDVPGSYTYEP